MTALAADFDRRIKQGMMIQYYPVAASTTMYKGSLSAINSSGYMVPAADTAGLRVVGVNRDHIDNSSGSNGDKGGIVLRNIVARMVCASATQAWVGQNVFVVDDNTVALAATVTNNVMAGKVVEYESATAVWVEVVQFDYAVAAQADAAVTLAAGDNIDTLTDSTGGTADDTVEDVSTVVTGVDGTGSNAASKADVDARLTSINNNFKEVVDQLITQVAFNTKAIADVANLETTINGLIADLEAAGIQR